MTSADDHRPKTPVDQWFEVFVYAPLGFALDARQMFPRFVDRGRNQVVLAKVIGKYAVQHGSKQMNGYLGQSHSQIAAVLQTLGVLPEEDEPRDDADVEAFETDAIVFELPVPDSTPTEVAEPAEAAEAAEPAKPAEPVEPAPAVAELAIPDYDTLSASQVVPRLAGLRPEELEAVRRYEAAERGRKTILGKIAQLQST